VVAHHEVMDQTRHDQTQAPQALAFVALSAQLAAATSLTQVLLTWIQSSSVLTTSALHAFHTGLKILLTSHDQPDA